MKKKIEEIVKRVVSSNDFEVLIPERENFGHYSTNVAMRMAKKVSSIKYQVSSEKNALELARELAEKISAKAPKGMFEKIEAVPPGFINFWLTKYFLVGELEKALGKKGSFGNLNLGKGKTVIVEYSSPNVAKPMHVGHLRSTIIGAALANLFEFLEYKVIRWNYIGDWGTQFGKMIAAYKLWGDRTKIEKNPIGELLTLYVRFSKEEKEGRELQGMGQKEFSKLERGNKENREIWEWVKRKSLEEFHQTYKKIGARFDLEVAESFFEKDLGPLVDDLIKRGIARESEGAIVVPLEEGMVPAVIRKFDGASLYITRELANLKYRIEKYHPAKILYVVANEQSFHFEQLFAVAKLLGWDKRTEARHVKFGLTLGPDGKKFATREGNLIPLMEVIEKAQDLAYGVVSQKNPEFSESKKRQIAETVGLAALKYYDLKENRQSDIIFDWGRMLDLRGNSAPYLLYTYARLNGILEKAHPSFWWRWLARVRFDTLEKDEELALVRKILEFPDVIEEAHDSLLTSNFCNYLYELCNLANRFYETTPVLSDQDASRVNVRLKLIEQVNLVLKRGLGLLGIRALDNI